METQATTQTLVSVSPDELRRVIETAIKNAVTEALAHNDQPKDPDEALSFDQVRLALKVSNPTLRKLVRSGRIHAVKTGRRWLVPKTEVSRFLAGTDAA